MPDEDSQTPATPTPGTEAILTPNPAAPRRPRPSFGPGRSVGAAAGTH
jgi:hypothetical protein